PRTEPCGLVYLHRDGRGFTQLHFHAVDGAEAVAQLRFDTVAPGEQQSGGERAAHVGRLQVHHRHVVAHAHRRFGHRPSGAVHDASVDAARWFVLRQRLSFLRTILLAVVAAWGARPAWRPAPRLTHRPTGRRLGLRTGRRSGASTTHRPTGRRIAYAPAGGPAHRLRTGRRAGASPTHRPTGRRIAYAPAGGPAHRLRTGRRAGASPTHRPTGRRIAYAPAGGPAYRLRTGRRAGASPGPPAGAAASLPEGGAEGGHRWRPRLWPLWRPQWQPAQSTSSSTMASPWPPPLQMLARPNCTPRFRISWANVSTMRAPLAPMGWPSAMAPPLTLTISGSHSPSRVLTMVTTAK